MKFGKSKMIQFLFQGCFTHPVFLYKTISTTLNLFYIFNLILVREQLKELNINYEKSENNLKALQSVGQIVGEILKQLTEEKYIVKATNGPRYVVGIRRGIDKAKLRQGTRVALDMTTLTIMRMLPREVDPLVYNMSHEDPGNISYAQIGGLSEQIRELREVYILFINLTNSFKIS